MTSPQTPPPVWEGLENQQSKFPISPALLRRSGYAKANGEGDLGGEVNWEQGGGSEVDKI